MLAACCTSLQASRSRVTSERGVGMFCLRLHYKRRSLQRRAHLTSLIAYLLDPKQDRGGPNHRVRLAGPPWAARLVQRASPFGGREGTQAAARDLVHQFFDHIHAGIADRCRPYRVYMHLVIGFPLNYAPRPTTKSATSISNSSASEYFFWLAATREVLDSLGVDESLPHLVVMHDDTKHIHAHVVVSLFADGIDALALYRQLTPRVIKDVTATFYTAHGWPIPSRALHEHYRSILRKCYGRNFEEEWACLGHLCAQEKSLKADPAS